MSYSVGIVGLPNAGKSTLFKALTRKAAAVAAHPFTTLDPNIGLVAVPDKHLKALAQLIKPPKVTPAQLEFVDIAGLVKGAAQGKGLGNQFLAEIRRVDLVCFVLRDFKNEAVTHTEGVINPKKDAEIIICELRLKDIEMLERRRNALSGKVASGDKALQAEHSLISQIIEKLNNLPLFEKLPNILDERKSFSILNELLSLKPRLFVINTNERAKTSFKPPNEVSLELNLQNELDNTELTQQECEELELPKPQLDRVIKACYDALNLITFYTVKGGEELRARALHRGADILRAAELIHTDFKEHFIRAEVTSWETLVKEKDWVQARTQGLIRSEGKDYIVQDGDVIEIKTNVYA